VQCNRNELSCTDILQFLSVQFVGVVHALRCSPWSCVFGVQTQTVLAASSAPDVSALPSVRSRLRADADCDDVQRVALSQHRGRSGFGLLPVQL